MHIVIIGNGIAGSSAARHLRKLSDHKITMISGESKYPFSRTALMYIYMGHMTYEHTKLYEDWFWEKNRIDLVEGWVEHIDTKSQSITMKNGDLIKYDKLIIGTGSKSNKFGWPGQELNGVAGLYQLQDMQALENASKDKVGRAVIVGGGLIGIEMAEMLASRKIPVTMLVRESSFWNNVLPPEESAMINQHIAEHHIDLRLATELKSINGSNKVISITTNHGEEISCGFVGLAVGVSPNINLLKDSGIETKRGILVNDLLATSVTNIYAIGDCAEVKTPKIGRKGIESIWYTGRMMGEHVARSIMGETVSYDPGIWFNSAKFLDIEYQVYGEITAELNGETESLYWQHVTEHKSVRINYMKDSGSVIGFNLMGVRYRHNVCEAWIKNKTNIKEVLANLAFANFDPEFYKQYESAIILQFKGNLTEPIVHRAKRKLRLVQDYLKTISLH